MKIDVKILKKVIITETFNVDFHNKFVKFWIICFSTIFHIEALSLSLYIYIYIYMKKNEKTNNPKFDEFIMKSVYIT